MNLPIKTILAAWLVAAGALASPPDSQPDRPTVSDAQLRLLIQQLADRSYEIRQEATRQLGMFDYSQLDRLAPLYQSLTHPEQKMRFRAAVQRSYIAAQRAGRMPEGFLGIQHIQLDSGQAATNTPAVLVNGVVADSPALAAGFREGDIIVSLNGQPLDIRPGRQFADEVSRLKPGQKVTLGVRRDGRKLELTATLGSRSKFAVADKDLPALQAQFSVIWHDRFDPSEPIVNPAGVRQIIIEDLDVQDVNIP